MKAIITEIDFAFLKRALRLPPEINIIRVTVPEDRVRCIFVYLEGEQFQDLPEGAILPVTRIEWQEYAKIPEF